MSGTQLFLFNVHVYQHLAYILNNTPWAIKKCHFCFYDNFGKCGPISIILLFLEIR